LKLPESDTIGGWKSRAWANQPNPYAGAILTKKAGGSKHNDT